MSSPEDSNAWMSNRTDRPPILVSERHLDPYEAKLGRGIPMYISIEEEHVSIQRQPFDGSTASEATIFPVSLNKAGQHVIERETDQLVQFREIDKQTPFRTPGGSASSNELWRFRYRGCQDAWMAFLFLVFTLTVSLWGVSELQDFQLTDEIRALISERTRQLGTIFNDKGQGIVSILPSARWYNQTGLATLNNTTSHMFVLGDRVTKALNITKQTWRDTVILKWISMVLLFVGLTLFITLLDIQLIRTMPRALISMFNWLNTFGLALAAFFFYLNGYFFMCFIFSLLTPLPVLWLYLVRSRIDFSVCLTIVASRILQRFYGLVFLSLGIGLVSLIYTFYMLSLLAPPSLRLWAGLPNTRDASYTLLVLLSLFWTNQMLACAMQVICSGVVATWYFAGYSKIPDSPIAKMLRRAFFDNFGSICLGSLLTAVMDFIRWFAYTASEESDDYSFLTCIFLCMLDFIDFLVSHFNQYAFVHVGIYGCNYFNAAKVTWQLTQQCLFAAVFNDCLVAQAMGMVVLSINLLLSFVAYVLTRSLVFTVVAFMISNLINSSIFQVWSTIVTAIFVCFAELPEGLEISFPELYESLMKYDAGMTGNRYQSTSQIKYGTL